jgi:AraC family transcriptional regulator
VQAGALLLDGLRDRGAGSAVVYESLARLFLVKLVTRYGVEPVDAPYLERGLSAPQHKRVLDHVAARFGEALPIEELASIAGLSPAHFSRVFRQATGESPHQFVMDYRIEQAKRMLEDPGRSLIDIALACGFADQPHLDRVFKQLSDPERASLARIGTGLSKNFGRMSKL